MENLAKLTDKQLVSLKSAIGEEEKRRRESRCKRLAKQARNTKNEYLIALSEAMLHVVCKIKPTQDKIGYYLARASSNLNKEEQKINNKMSEYFDLIDYVFATTHYDEYSNGYFFRRS